MNESTKRTSEGFAPIAPIPVPSIAAGRAGGKRSKRRKVQLSLAIVGLVLSLTSAGTWAAWTAIDTNPNNTFSTDTVLISDNQGGEGGSATATGTAMFNVTNLNPGSSSTTACIGVDFTGSATALTLGATLGGAGQAALGSQLTMNTATYNTGGTVTITPGSNTNSGSCTNYPSSGTNTTIGTQGATLTTWGSGGPYTISSPVTNTWYKFTVSGLPAGDSSCATYCSQTITVTLDWTLTAT